MPGARSRPRRGCGSCSTATRRAASVRRCSSSRRDPIQQKSHACLFKVFLHFTQKEILQQWQFQKWNVLLKSNLRSLELSPRRRGCRCSSARCTGASTTAGGSSCSSWPTTSKPCSRTRGTRSRPCGYEIFHLYPPTVKV